MNVQGSLKAMVCIFLWCGLGSCDLFKTRTPEEPLQSNSTYPPPTSASIVFENLERAFNEMNSVYYMNSFADSVNSAYSFTFEPAPRAKSNFPGTFTNWSKPSEQVYFENVRSKMQKGRAPSLDFLTLNRQSVQPDSEQYEATYRLVVYVQPDITFRAEGRAQFVLVADRFRNWAIRYWIDFPQPPADTTWSDLKGIAFTQW